MNIKNMNLVSETDRAPYHNTTLFSNYNLEKYGQDIKDIFEINGQKYPGIVLAYHHKISDLSQNTTQEQANTYSKYWLNAFLKTFSGIPENAYDLDSWDPTKGLPDYLKEFKGFSAKEFLVNLPASENVLYLQANKNLFDGEDIFLFSQYVDAK